MVPVEIFLKIDTKFISYPNTYSTWNDMVQGYSTLFSLNQSGKVEYEGKVIYYNGVLVAGTDNLVQYGDYFTINDLTGTKWVLNKYLAMPAMLVNGMAYAINFTSNGSNYTTFDYVPTPMGNELSYGNGTVYTHTDDIPPTDTWIDEAYRIIEITGGTDATNTSLIQWLLSNATQVPVVDLTNTIWAFGSSVVIENANQVQDYAINYSLEVKPNEYIPTILENGTSFEIETQDISSWEVGNFKRAYRVKINTNDCGHFSDAISGGNGAIFATYTLVTSPTYPQTLDRTDNYSATYVKKIMISSGTDATNPDLIAWLSQNATLQQPTPTKTFDLTTLQLSAGTHTVQVKARGQGYRDSNFSNSVTYNVPQKYSGNIETYSGFGTADTKIKFDTPPQSENDYDSATWSGFSNIDGLTSYQNKTKIYIWSGLNYGIDGKVKINNIETNGGTTYDTAVELDLTGDYTIYLYVGLIA